MNNEGNLAGFRFFGHNSTNQIQSTDFKGLVQWLNESSTNKAYTSIQNPDGTYRRGTEVKIRLSSVSNGNVFDNLENLPKY